MDNLTFHLDSVSTYPFQSGPPVFTLTCNSSGGPATTVQWWRDSREVHDGTAYVNTSSLVDQSGPDYTSTLRVKGKRNGKYHCAVSNSKGASGVTLTVRGTWRITLTVHGYNDGSTFVHLIILLSFQLLTDPRAPLLYKSMPLLSESHGLHHHPHGPLPVGTGSTTRQRVTRYSLR